MAAMRPLSAMAAALAIAVALGYAIRIASHK
jgi:hypothetical protein